MKKILILSIAGKKDQAEDVKNLHLYLVSVKEQLVPFYDVKVILFNACISSEKTIDLVKQYGLENVVDVKRLDEMELPQKSYDFMNSLGFATRIGLLINMMFDYSKNNNFFGADWIFHTDTDTEFSEKFKPIIDKCEEMLQVNSSVFISQMGDVNKANIVTNNKIGYFDSPRRLNLYDENETLDEGWNSFKFNVVNLEEHQRVERPTFNCEALKIKNDIIGFSRDAAQSVTFNWTAVESIFKIRNAQGFIIDGQNTDDWASESDVSVVINKDKGGLVLFDVQSSTYGIIHVQLPIDTILRHVNAGWIHSLTYHERALEALTSKYENYKNIWENDFVQNTQESIENEIVVVDGNMMLIQDKISQLETSLNEIKELLKNISK